MKYNMLRGMSSTYVRACSAGFSSSEKMADTGFMLARFNFPLIHQIKWLYQSGFFSGFVALADLVLFLSFDGKTRQQGHQRYALGAANQLNI